MLSGRGFIAVLVAAAAAAPAAVAAASSPAAARRRLGRAAASTTRLRAERKVLHAHGAQTAARHAHAQARDGPRAEPRDRHAQAALLQRGAPLLGGEPGNFIFEGGFWCWGRGVSVCCSREVSGCGRRAWAVARGERLWPAAPSRSGHPMPRAGATRCDMTRRARRTRVSSNGASWIKALAGRLGTRRMASGRGRGVVP